MQSPTNQYQDLSQFQVPADFRGRSGWFVQLWWICERLLFRPSPHIANGWRNFLLRAFGAKVGRNVVIRRTATITYPWKVSIGDYSWIGSEVVLYSLGEIVIGSHSVISQRSYLCGGSHEIDDLAFRITSAPIRIGNECWLATDVFVSPGVEIGHGTLVGARSTVTKSLPGGVIAMGTPARVIRDRPPSRPGAAGLQHGRVRPDAEPL